MMNKEKVIAAFFFGFVMIGMASLLFIYGVMLREGSETHVSYSYTPPKNIKQKTKVFNAKSYVLDNGLQIVVIENNRAPVLTHMVWYRVGAADEPAGKSGIAHFLEHLMFKGQSHPELGTLEPGEFSRKIRALGGEDNAFTSQDYTAYFQSIASEHLETVMTMEAGRMRGLTPPEDEVISENNVIREERLQRTDNHPRAQMREQLTEALFPNHPYSLPIIGWMHEIETLTWDDAKSFYDRYYAPNNAILVVSGDVTGEEVLEIAQRTYGLIEQVDVPTRTRTQSPPFIAKTSITLTHETVGEPVIQRLYRVPSYRQNKEHSLALQVLEEVISGGSTSRLYKSLVTKQRLATEIGLSYSSSAWDDSTLSIVATVQNATQVDALQVAIDTELKKVITSGITKTELNEAVKRMQAEAIYARDSLSGPAMIIGYNMVTGSSLDDIEYWPSSLSKITRKDVQEVARLYLNPEEASMNPPVYGLLLPIQDQAPQETPEMADTTGE
ncbi:MAG: M16 family metallopeptidase [Alphaproteobacteria bacterium]